MTFYDDNFEDFSDIDDMIFEPRLVTCINTTTTTTTTTASSPAPAVVSVIAPVAVAAEIPTAGSIPPEALQTDDKDMDRLSRSAEGISAIIGYDFQKPLCIWEAVHIERAAVLQPGLYRHMPDGNRHMAVRGGQILRAVLRSRASNPSNSFTVKEIRRKTSNAYLATVADVHGLTNFMQWDVERVNRRDGYLSMATRAKLVLAIILSLQLWMRMEEEGTCLQS